MTMKIKIQKNINIRHLSSWVILLTAMFSGFLDHISILRYIIVALLFILCVTNIKVIKNIKRVVGGLALLLIVLYTCITINMSIHTEWYAFGSNMRMLLYVLVSVLLILLLANTGSDDLLNFLEKRIKLINIFGIVNMIVLTIQIYFIYGFMMRNEWLAMNSYYPDLCCGLFGYNATHEMSYFFCFWIMLNFYFIFNKSRTKLKQKLMLFYTIAIIIWMGILSTQNDNVAFFVIFIIFFICYMLYYIIYKYKIPAKIIYKYLKYGLFIALIIGILVNIPYFNTYLEETLFIKISGVLSADFESANGSNERIAIVKYALDNGFGWTTGLGLGSQKWYANGFLGFEHFGLNSISSFIVLGGMPFYVIYVTMFSWILWKIDANKKSFMWLLAIILMIIMSSIYTIIFTSYVTAIWLSLMFCVFVMTKNNLLKNEVS